MTKHVNAAKLLTVSELEPAKIRWVIENLCAKGKVTAVASEGGAGGSLMAIDTASRVTAGLDYPVPIGQIVKGDVLFLVDSLDIAEEVQPRLLAAKADLDNLHLATTDEVVSEVLTNLLDGLPTIDLLVVDVDYRKANVTASANTARLIQLIDDLREFANAKDLAVLIVAGAAQGAIENGPFMSAIVQSKASIVFTLRRGANHSRNLVPAKNSLSFDTTAYSFSIVQSSVAEGILAPHLDWLSDFDAGIIRPSVKSSYAGRRAAAASFAMDHLFDGKKTVEYFAEAKALGLSEEMVRDAAKELKYDSKREEGFAGGGCWVWRKEPEDPEQKKKTKKSAWGK